MRASARLRIEQGRSRTEAVHEALWQVIIEQQLQPSARLPEDAVGDAFGTSRTIAREALGRLAVEGLVVRQFIARKSNSPARMRRRPCGSSGSFTWSWRG
jgi:DNA-binding GntR family transcriptional regulator